ncbi:GH1 family beta-glucosidase [Jannaschia formosa]|uniref:GH1 family beta-glucosidase n=1 Tax=Jannaschia formosa TaxID=2259592 RepID=UPI000E1B89FA|nr:GH1 family beta-glucosidase [Jannaschia formosa]TFL16725.1 beta-glucosidase [Jannaschia formosa]
MTETEPRTAFTVRRSDFPEGFVFATATSAYQIEGHAFGGAGRTHWDSFSEQPGKVARGENGAVACDHYHRWEEDLDLIAQAGFDGYRFSTSWARVMPDGETVNPEGLDFYDRLVDGMLARGLKPMATMYHWELPETLARRGGWTSREIPERFAEFTRTVADRIGDRLWSVAPVNEPWCVAWLSHYLGQHAPGLTDLGAAAKAMHHVCLAHGLSAQALRAAGVGNVGAVCNMEWALPASDSPEDAAAADLYDAIYSRWFASAFNKGVYPEIVLDGLAPHMPANWQDDMAAIAQPLDWFGINYYTCSRVVRTGGEWPALDTVPGPLPKTEMGWEIAPEGLGVLLRRTAQDYTGDLPIYVTENGLAHDDHDLRPDHGRIDYLDRHLAVARDAIADGVPLAGYTIWSLLDNYEWALGYDKRFGLVHVDFDTQARTPKASYHGLARALAE